MRKRLGSGRQEDPRFATDVRPPHPMLEPPQMIRADREMERLSS